MALGSDIYSSRLSQIVKRITECYCITVLLHYCKKKKNSDASYD